MYKKKIKYICVALFSCCFLWTQVTNIALATEKEPAEANGVPEGITLNYLEMEPVDSSFAGTEEHWDFFQSIPLPSSYCSSADFPEEVEQREDRVTSVKNQTHGMCWAYSAMSLAESSYIINQGVSPDSVDFNEYHLVHYANGQAADSLNLFDGDYNTSATGENILEKGGNNLISLCTLASWQGASNASEMEFGDTNIENGDLPENILGYGDAAHLENGYILTMPDMSSADYQTDMDIIKKMIIEYGSVAISYYAEHSPDYFLACHQYIDEEHTTNHSVAVVGWDDTVSASSYAIEPPGDGAWIVKNSWGDDWGADGYFYLSYYDATIGLNAFAFDFVSGEKYQNNYQYDGSGSFIETVGGCFGQVSAANAFVADSNETLEAVGFYTKSINTDYEIRIYRELEKGANPNTGTLVLTQTGTQTYEGYHTVELDEKIPIAQGERYAVVVSFIGEENEYISFAANKVESVGWTDFYSHAKAGESYFGQDVASLSDLNPKNDEDFLRGINVRIKAFTNEAENLENIAVTNIGLDKTECKLDKGNTEKLTVSIMPANATNAKVAWSSSDENVATVDQQGNVYGVAGGTATITVTAQDGSAKRATCLVTVKEVFAEGLQITVDGEPVSYYRIEQVGNGFRVGTVFYPSDTTNQNVTWSSSNPSVLTVDQNGYVSAVGAGYTLLTATAQDGSGISSTCFIAVQRIMIDSITILADGVEKDQIDTTEIGKRYSLEAVLNPVEAEMFDVTWESSDSDVATVDENGVVTIKSVGWATIRASVTLDFTYTQDIYICVQEETYPAEQIDITLDGASVTELEMFGLWTYYNLGTTVLPENASNKNISWSSSNENIAFVHQNGLLMPVSYGTAIITATATDGSGVSDSVKVTIRKEEELIPVPEKPHKISNLSTGVRVQWRKADGAEQYNVWRSENGKNGTYICLAKTKNLSYTDKTVQSGKTYYYKIAVYDAGLEKCGEKSPAVGIKFLSVPKVTSYENISTGIKLKWKKVTGTSGYEIYRKDYSGSDSWKKVAAINSGTKVTYTDTSIKSKNGTTYQYRLKAISGTAASDNGADIKVTRLVAPALKSAKKVNNTSLKCTWSTKTKVTGYEVRLKVGSKVYKTYKIKGAKTSSKTIKALTKGKKYKIQVRSYKKVSGAGTSYSAWSGSKSVTLKK